MAGNNENKDIMDQDITDKDVTANKDSKDSSYYELVKSSMEIDYKDQTFENFFGAEQTVQMLKECIVLPLRFPHLFEGARSPSFRSLMLFGAPGCGKSHLLFAAAKAADVKIFVFNAWQLQNRSICGKIGVEKCIETIFEVVEKNTPCILCFEDFEVFSKKESHFEKGRIALIHKLTAERNKAWTNKFFVIGVTLGPWDVDAYLRRLFVRRTGSYVYLSDKAARIQHLKYLLKGMSHDLKEEDFETLAENTPDYSGSDIVCFVRDASMEGVRELMKATHFKKMKLQDIDVTSSIDDAHQLSSKTSNTDTTEQVENQGSVPSVPSLQENVVQLKSTEKFVACKPEEDGAICMSVLDIPEDKLFMKHEITMWFLQKTLNRIHSSICEKELAKFKKFEEEFC